MNFMERVGLSSPVEPLAPLELPDQFRRELLDDLKDEYQKYYSHVHNCKRFIKGNDLANWYYVTRKVWVRLFKMENSYFDENHFWAKATNIILNHRAEYVLQLVEEIAKLVCNEQPSFQKMINEIFQRHQAPYLLRKTEQWGWAIIETGSGYEKDLFLEALAGDETWRNVQFHLEKSAKEIKEGDYPKAIDQAWKSVEACIRISINEKEIFGNNAINKFLKSFASCKTFKPLMDILLKSRNNEPDAGHSLKPGVIELSTQRNAKAMLGLACVLIPYMKNCIYNHNHNN